MPRTNDLDRSRRASAVTVGLALVVTMASASYEVRPGDTLAGIAAANDTTVAELADLNGLSDPDLIRIGQVLTLPGDLGPATHTVAAGETLAGIAAAYGLPVRALVEANELANPDLLTIGQLLTVPGGSSSEAREAAPASTTHIVAAGETLASIALRYDTTVEAIAAANGLSDPSTIYVGTRLAIGGESQPTVTGSGSSSGYVVEAGDTLAGIAGRFGTTVHALRETNGITDPNLITVGQQLTVPAAGWVCPVGGGRYFNDWGFPRSGGRFHQGTDLFAPRGSEVRAPVSGFVELKSGVVGGLQFWLTGDDGNTYIGTHLDGFGEAGEVTAGTVVGYVGTTGNAVGSDPHLHFEILVDGSPINPFPTLRENGC